MMNETIVENFANNSNSKKTLPENSDVAALIRFMRQIKIPQLFAAIPDERQQSKITYSLSSLTLWAFAACIFRQGSKNALQTTLEQLSSEERQGMLNFLGINSKDLPHSSTVDDALARVNYESFNHILLDLFDQMNTRKMFYNHAAVLLPDNTYHIGTDGCHLHTYTHPHAVDDQGNNCCPYCLPRKHCAGTDHEKIYWVHVVVTLVFVCEGFTIPLHIYPLKAQQVNTCQSDEKLKQECELLAARAVLPMIRERFPRLNFTFLGDGLYANRPFIKFCSEIGFNYIIVRKELSLVTLGRKCDELARLNLYKKSYTRRDTEKSKKTTVNKMAAWFNKADLGDGLSTNVLRFEEEIHAIDGQVVSRYKCEWLCSERLSQNNCMRRAQRGRLRWNQEDFHNTCKNRGFSIEHDMARANPSLLFTWKLVAILAFFVSEIFNYSTLAKKARGRRSLMKFAKDMLQELINCAWEKIVSSVILQKERVQFRFYFGCDP